jgi:DNA polymerase-3 subunit alpha
LQLSSHPVQSISAIDDDGRPVVPEGTAVTIGGMISSMRKTYTKKQEPMGILRVEGLGNASCEAVAFPSVYDKYQEFLLPDALVFLQGVVRQNAQGVSLAIENVIPMDEARARLVDFTTIDLTGVDSDQFDDVLERIRSVCSMNPGNSVLHIRMNTIDGATALVQAGDDYRILPSESLEEVVKNLAGRNSFFLIPRVFEAPAQRNGKRGYYRGNGHPARANQSSNSAPAGSPGGGNGD